MNYFEESDNQMDTIINNINESRYEDDTDHGVDEDINEDTDIEDDDGDTIQGTNRRPARGNTGRGVKHLEPFFMRQTYYIYVMTSFFKLQTSKK